MLLIEISEPSADYDREVKLPLYAGAGIADVWIVHLGVQTIEIHAIPVTTPTKRSRWRDGDRPLSLKPQPVTPSRRTIFWADRGFFPRLGATGSGRITPSLVYS
jgi:hypothetical protein